MIKYCKHLYIVCNIDKIVNFSLTCSPLDATNASKHSIDQSEDRILQINQSFVALSRSQFLCLFREHSKKRLRMRVA